MGMREYYVTLNYIESGDTANTFRWRGKQVFRVSNLPRGKCHACGKRRIVRGDWVDGRIDRIEQYCAECTAERDLSTSLRLCRSSRF